MDRYPLDRIKMPKNFLPEYPQKEKIGAAKGLRDEKFAPFPRDKHAVKVNRQEYYAIKAAKLYHLTEDPQEMKDLAADPAMSDRQKTSHLQNFESCNRNTTTC